MVSAVWSMIALSTGLLVYFALPALAPSLPILKRQGIGRYYYRLAAKCYGQFAFVRRVLGGYEIKPIKVDDEQKLAKITLSSGMISDDKELPFKDPDNRIARLYNKPCALVCETIPAAVDAELAELGYWLGEHETKHGLEREENGTTVIDPYFRVGEGLRLIDPVETLHLVSKDVDPENIETAVQLTKQRYEKYKDGIGLAESVGALMGFAVGAGAVVTIRYVNVKILGGGGGGGGGGIGGGGGPVPPIGIGSYIDVGFTPMLSMAGQLAEVAIHIL